MKFACVSWFRDLRFPPDDQDYEWPCCFAIESPSLESAKRWGIHLGARYSSETGDVLLQTVVEPLNPADPASPAFPVVVDGEEDFDVIFGRRGRTKT
jgi:hypothetical protein